MVIGPSRSPLADEVRYVDFGRRGGQDAEEPGFLGQGEARLAAPGRGGRVPRVEDAGDFNGRGAARRRGARGRVEDDERRSDPGVVAPGGCKAEEEHEVAAA